MCDKISVWDNAFSPLLKEIHYITPFNFAAEVGAKSITYFQMGSF